MLHAKLSPSDSERWLDCPAAISMDENFTDQESFEAAEGTAAHELAAIEARYAFGQIDERQLFDLRDEWIKANERFDQKEISRYIDAYVANLVDRAKGAKLVFIEHVVKTEVTDIWGTADFILIDEGWVEIVDLKYGKGVFVEAQGNPQIRIYGVGVLDFCVGLVMAGLLDNMPTTVALTIYQPRMGNFGTEEMSSADLYDWFDDEVRPAAEKVFLPNPSFGPSEKACRWCPASGQCTAQMEKQLMSDFGDPKLMSPEQIAGALERVKEISSWLEDVQKVALHKAYSEGVSIPGWKVVRSAGSRVIRDQPAAIMALVEAGYPPDKVAPRKVKGIGDLEKLVGKDRLTPILGDILERRTGVESLVRSSDKRDPINPNESAKEDFS